MQRSMLQSVIVQLVQYTTRRGKNFQAVRLCMQEIFMREEEAERRGRAVARAPAAVMSVGVGSEATGFLEESISKALSVSAFAPLHSLEIII